MSRMAPFAVLLVVSCATAVMSETAEERTARYFDSVRKNPSLLLAFLEQMPKGGDLHNHMGGAIGPRREKFPPAAACSWMTTKKPASSGNWKKSSKISNCSIDWLRAEG